jgi:peroxiredoxin
VELQERYDDFKSLGVEVLTISVDTEADAHATLDRLGVTFPVLYDSTKAVARSWEVFDLLNDGVAAPATYLFDGSGDLLAYHIGTDIADRPSTAEVYSSFLAAR